VTSPTSSSTSPEAQPLQQALLPPDRDFETSCASFLTAPKAASGRVRGQADRSASAQSPAAPARSSLTRHNCRPLSRLHGAGHPSAPCQAVVSAAVDCWAWLPLLPQRIAAFRSVWESPKPRVRFDCTWSHDCDVSDVVVNARQRARARCLRGGAADCHVASRCGLQPAQSAGAGAQDSYGRAA